MKNILMRRIACLAVMCTLIFAAAGVSADDAVLTLSLTESIDMALERSIAVHSAKTGVAVSEAERKEARTSFFPTLSTTYTAMRLNDEPTSKQSGIQVGTRDNFSWEVEATQPLFAGGTIVNSYKISRIGVDIAREEEKVTVQDVVLDVTAAYFGILKAERILEVARQSVEQLQAHRDIAESFFEVGIIPKNDLLYAEVELASGNQGLVTAENGVQLAKAQFNMLLRRGVNAPIEVEDILCYQPFDMSLENCLSAAYAKRPEIRAYEMQVDQARLSVDVARGEFYPTVGLAGHYGKYGDEPGVSGSPYDHQEDWYVMAVVDWDFWQWGKTRYAVDASKGKEIQARDALEYLKDRIALEVKNNYLTVREAEKKISVAEKAIEQAEENFRINQERYKEQVATSTDVIDAQTLLTRTKSDYYNALSDYNIAIAELERSIGGGQRVTS